MEQLVAFARDEDARRFGDANVAGTGSSPAAPVGEEACALRYSTGEPTCAIWGASMSAGAEPSAERPSRRGTIGGVLPCVGAWAGTVVGRFGGWTRPQNRLFYSRL